MPVAVGSVQRGSRWGMSQTVHAKADTRLVMRERNQPAQPCIELNARPAIFSGSIAARTEYSTVCVPTRPCLALYSLEPGHCCRQIQVAFEVYLDPGSRLTPGLRSDEPCVVRTYGEQTFWRVLVLAGSSDSVLCPTTSSCLYLYQLKTHHSPYQRIPTIL